MWSGSHDRIICNPGLDGDRIHEGSDRGRIRDTPLCDRTTENPGRSRIMDSHGLCRIADCPLRDRISDSHERDCDRDNPGLFV